MESILLIIGEISVIVGIMIAVVISLRFLMRKAPKWIRCLMWGIVALRLITPFTVESPFGILPDSDSIQERLKPGANADQITGAIGVLPEESYPGRLNTWDDNIISPENADTLQISEEKSDIEMQSSYAEESAETDGYPVLWDAQPVAGMERPKDSENAAEAELNPQNTEAVQAAEKGSGAEENIVEIQNPEAQNTQVQNPEIQNPGVQNPKIQNAEIQNSEEQNSEEQNSEKQNSKHQNTVFLSGKPGVKKGIFYNPKFYTLLGTLWISGIVIMLAFMSVSRRRVRSMLSEAVLLKDNIYLCDMVDSPFLLGVIRPSIYLPSGMEEDQMDHVLAHEHAHLKRGDHIWKPLGFFILCIYWFHPLVWIAYMLFCRDIELACDEKVVKDMDLAERKAYSQTLLSMSVQKKLVLACPLAFGEDGVKERIKNVLKFKKTTRAVIAGTVAVCGMVAVLFLTSRPHKEILPFTIAPGADGQTIFLSEVEISPKSGHLTIWAQDGIDEGAILLIDAATGELYSYAAPVYFERALPVEFEVVKDNWYLVGLLTSNETGSERSVTVGIRNVNTKELEEEDIEKIRAKKRSSEDRETGERNRNTGEIGKESAGELDTEENQRVLVYDPEAGLLWRTGETDSENSGKNSSENGNSSKNDNDSDNGNSGETESDSGVIPYSEHLAEATAKLSVFRGILPDPEEEMVSWRVREADALYQFLGKLAYEEGSFDNIPEITVFFDDGTIALIDLDKQDDGCGHVEIRGKDQIVSLSATETLQLEQLVSPYERREYNYDPNTDFSWPDGEGVYIPAPQKPGYGNNNGDGNDNGNGNGNGGNGNGDSGFGMKHLTELPAGEPTWLEVTESGVDEELFKANLDVIKLSQTAYWLQEAVRNEMEEEKQNPEIVLSQGWMRIFDSTAYRQVLKLGSAAEKPLYWILYKSDGNGLYEYLCAAALEELSGFDFTADKDEPNLRSWSNAKEFLAQFTERILEENKKSGQPDTDIRIENYYTTDVSNSDVTYHIDENNVLWGRGYNQYGQLGIGSTDYDFHKEPVKIAENVIHVDYSGTGFMIFLTKDHELFGMGANGGGALLGTSISLTSLQNQEKYTVTTPRLLMKNVIYARSGRDDVVCLSVDGSVWTWGTRWWQGNGVFAAGIKQDKILEDAVFITGGAFNHAALTRDGDVYTWGYNYSGNCGVEGVSLITEPVKVAEDVSMVWTGTLEYNTYPADSSEVPGNNGSWHDGGGLVNTILLKQDGTYLACGNNVGQERVLPVYYDAVNYCIICSPQFVRIPDLSYFSGGNFTH